jgi:hypothetical protein
MKQKQALKGIDEMVSEAEAILGTLVRLREGVKTLDASVIRKALDSLADETYSHGGGIIGFRPRVDAACELVAEIEETDVRSSSA